MEGLAVALANTLGKYVAKEVVVFIVSMIPILELRGGLIVASLLQVPITTAIPICIIGNMLPVPIIYFFARKVLIWGKDKKYIGKFYCAVRAHGDFSRSAAIYRTDYAARNSRRRRRSNVVRRDIRLICRVRVVYYRAYRIIFFGVKPGALKDAKIDEKVMAHQEAIIRAMTPAERTKPEIIGGSRKKRIADGSGTSVEDVNKLLRQFDQIKKLMKQFSNPSRLGRLGKGKMKIPF